MTLATKPTVDGMTAATQEAPKPPTQLLPHGLNLQPRTYEEMERFCRTVSKSGLTPKGMNNEADIFVAVQYGNTIGLPPMQAVQAIAVINGRPSIYGDAMLAICRSSPLFDQAAFVEALHGDMPQDDYHASCTVRRKGEGVKPCTVSYSIADAKKAGLWGKAGPWSSYPKRMLQMRARSFALRDTFPDLLGGMYAREEVIDTIMDQIDTRPGFDPDKTAADSLAETLKARRTEQATEHKAPSPVADESTANDSDTRNPAPAAAPLNDQGTRESDAQAQIDKLEAVTKLRTLIKKLWSRLDDEKRAAQRSNCKLESIEDVETITDLKQLRSIADSLLGA